jgi:hypothetical protein
MTDVSVKGSFGLYTLDFLTRKGRTYERKHLSQGDRTHLGEALICEGVRQCAEIIVAMNRAGLAVSLNGVDMKGFVGRR